MHWERLTTSGRPVYAEAMDLYRASFPSHEQREEAAQRELMGRPEYHFNLIYEEERLAGLLLCWETERFLYVEHFCIHPLFRGRGYGQRALEMLRERGLPVILEIDPPVDAVARRRRAFYERAGYQANPFEHVHPPYHRDCRGHALMVLSQPRRLTGEEYADFQRYLTETVMGG